MQDVNIGIQELSATEIDLVSGGKGLWLLLVDAVIDFGQGFAQGVRDVMGDR
jgi:lactobin A/cerein 7B family class IIb bacteriocin